MGLKTPPKRRVPGSGHNNTDRPINGRPLSQHKALRPPLERVKGDAPRGDGVNCYHVGSLKSYLIERHANREIHAAGAAKRRPFRQLLPEQRMFLRDAFEVPKDVEDAQVDIHFHGDENK